MPSRWPPLARTVASAWGWCGSRRDLTRADGALWGDVRKDDGIDCRLLCARHREGFTAN
jgi:hypothetical protein